jgi:hypothetical protein
MAALLGSAGCAPEKSSLPTGPETLPSFGLEECGAANVFVAAHFSNSNAITNTWFPLTPGTRYTLEGFASRTGQPLDHQVIFTVTDLTKVVNGVRTLVMWDRDIADSVLVEAELAFFAQDDEGNIWTMGEYPEEYENGVFVGAPSTWIAGQHGAEAGILLPGQPEIGFKFLQGYVADINFLDCGVVAQRNQSTCVQIGCFNDVLVIAERSPLEPGTGQQLKYYAPGVGNIRVGAVADVEAETLELIESRPLTLAELEEARAGALALEARAYQINAAYRGTPPMELPGGRPEMRTAATR